MTWSDVSARLGRNDMPYALAMAVFRDMAMTEPEDIAKGVADAWTMCEWPAGALDQDIWSMLFAYATEDLVDGYLHDDEVKARDELPETVTLWRGAIEDHRLGMSWTDDRQRAHWFAHRFDGIGGEVGHLYQVTVDRDVVLARFEKRRGESEWVLDPSYLEDLDIEDLGE